jgi:hypothetical protein
MTSARAASRRLDRAGAAAIRARQMSTTQAGIATLGFGQLYVSIGDPAADGTVAGAPLLEAAGDLHLARRLPDGARRRAVARRPPLALRRAGARQIGRRRAGGGVTMKTLRRSRRRARSRRRCAPPCSRRDDEGPRARGARPVPVGRTALHGVPEPVDRRFRRAAGARHPLLIRDRIANGDSNDAVRAFLVSRYGDFILLKPPLNTLLVAETLLLGMGGDAPPLSAGRGSGDR